MGSLIVRAINSLLTFCATLSQDAWDQLVTLITTLPRTLVFWFLDALPTDWQESLRVNAVLENIWSLTNFITFVFPLGAVMTIIMGAYSIQASIRIIRWVKSFIPAVVGGGGSG